MADYVVNQNETFAFTYSAKQKEEIESIKKKYLPKEEVPKEVDKMQELRRLDRSAEMIATIWAIVVGVVGTLVFGTGMSFTLAFNEKLFIPGIVIGIVGMTGIALALPVYRIGLKKQREKIAPKILALTEELSGF